jgi:hypothetical protein
MQEFRPSVRPPAFCWPLTVRGCGSRWSHCQRINNDLIRKAGGSFASVEALDFQQHHTQERPGRSQHDRKRRWQLKSVAAACRQARLPDLYCVLK